MFVISSPNKNCFLLGLDMTPKSKMLFEVAHFLNMIDNLSARFIQVSKVNFPNYLRKIESLKIFLKLRVLIKWLGLIQLATDFHQRLKKRNYGDHSSVILSSKVEHSIIILNAAICSFTNHKEFTNGINHYFYDRMGRVENSSEKEYCGIEGK